MRLRKNQWQYKVHTDVVSIENAHLFIGKISYILRVVSDEEFNAMIRRNPIVKLKGIPIYICLDKKSPLHYIRIYPVPKKAMGLVLHILKTDII